MFLIEMNDFDFRAVLWSGVFYHEGHYVSFKINKDETVFVKEVLEKANSTHKTSKYIIQIHKFAWDYIYKYIYNAEALKTL